MMRELNLKRVHARQLASQIKESKKYLKIKKELSKINKKNTLKRRALLTKLNKKFASDFLNSKAYSRESINNAIRNNPELKAKHKTFVYDEVKKQYLKDRLLFQEIGTKAYSKLINELKKIKESKKLDKIKKQ